ncbi:MAG: hypothetical protein WC607_01290 [Candidatus Micrarchaeia archaeon]
MKRTLMLESTPENEAYLHPRIGEALEKLQKRKTLLSKVSLPPADQVVLLAGSDGVHTQVYRLTPTTRLNGIVIVKRGEETPVIHASGNYLRMQAVRDFASKLEETAGYKDGAIKPVFHETMPQTYSLYDLPRAKIRLSRLFGPKERAQRTKQILEAHFGKYHAVEINGNAVTYTSPSNQRGQNKVRITFSRWRNPVVEAVEGDASQVISALKNWGGVKRVKLA